MRLFGGWRIHPLGGVKVKPATVVADTPLGSDGLGVTGLGADPGVFAGFEGGEGLLTTLGLAGVGPGLSGVDSAAVVGASGAGPFAFGA